MSSIAEWRAVGLPTLTAWVLYLLGQVQRAQGGLDASARTCRQALEMTAVPGRPPPPAAGPAYVGLGEVAYQRNELDTALRRITEGISCAASSPTSRRWPPAWSRWRGSGRPAAIRVGPWRLSPRPRRPHRARRARSTRSRRSGPGCCWPRATSPQPPAGSWSAGCTADDQPDYSCEPGHLVLARVLLAQARPGPALALLDRLHAAAAAQDRVGSLIEIGALRALALAARGEADRAVDVLAEALTLACPQGDVRVFADEGPPMAALLARLIAAQRSGGAAAEIPLGCLARLQRALGAQDIAPGAGRDGVTAVPGLVEQLTSRELEVLEMLAAGRSNQAIASQLVVTLDTVKKHVSHVLGKLGAANRTEAVSRARELSLIP